ncbi:MULTISPECIES: 23S rRNA pseudouridine(1911/1915/1917) synthase RluD [Alloalcanivorax]|uniref:Pseudouridine synthase n=2 Tax=Alloalcanivorax TaxID=3020832 RepID=A0A9Q3ZFQ0_9GAMM|nr:MULTISPECIES: 23S rRNA pseudouridine(1911/1915/1917) synthase RluD [Alloalcanivorax]ERS11241.1 23S rRNA pseudouridine synthase D [Alcanivorax sp. PN-3]MBA4723064.1 23S rRNA pseudouridine(1911/1915/1917) synthase RluD [Alcanivorax sp.]ARB47037.1 ribosomal large subunit pseudouridine synthase D [Alloalcanivorax xenomutans]MCE7509926.1 23S rRNA pseudouridine(1911/1915/1917) synthase RluD [Alloalcanivorax xenomutans]MCE7523969.1 23S rRNA pseudouridine(1911/1915/1917) synthase RluD [Alloalcanivo
MGHLGGEKIQRTEQVSVDHAGARLDQVAAELFEGFSRSRLQTWIKQGALTVNGRKARPKDKLVGGESLTLEAELAPELEDQPEAISLPVVYEDEDLIVINKPAGLVVHPAAGHADGTLLNGLLHLDERLSSLPRAGIVHRLDRDTTGLMVVARSLEAHSGLVAQLQDKSLHREYEAIAVGVMTGGGTVDAPIGRHPVDRKRQAVVAQGGKPAVTHFRVMDRYRAHTRIQVRLETGRTHQIRVHMAHRHYPLVGDPLYGGRLKFPAGATEALREALRRFPRQALHARRLGLVHPVSGEYLEFETPLPEDLQTLIRVLEEDREAQ